LGDGSHWFYIPFIRWGPDSSREAANFGGIVEANVMYVEGDVALAVQKWLK